MMGGPKQTSDVKLANHAASPSLGQVIEDLCDVFERRWKEGQRPPIEETIGRIGEEDRGRLLSHLIGVEIYWRRQLGENPSPDEYHQRFPGAQDIIQRQFHADETNAGSLPSTSLKEGETVVYEPGHHDDRGGADLAHEIGRLGNYRLINEIGRGGMGVVYRAWQPSADRFVALKVIRRDRLQSLSKKLQASVIDRFRHEAQATGRIEHDHIVTVYEVGEVDGEHFFSMRLVDGCSLFEILKEGPLDSRRIAHYIEPVARGLHEAHLHGILHRDLKPQNILVDSKTDRALLADFGLAKLAQEAEGATLAGEVMGTPAYMSPEQAHDSSRVTAKSDVYALGATLFHMLIGRPPFQGSTTLEIIRHVADDHPGSPRELNPAIDRDMDTICLKCLEKDPARRYGSAEALADDLQRYCNGEPIEARPVTPVEQVWRWCRRNPLLAASTAAAVLFLIVALMAATVGYVQTSASLAIAEREREKAEESDRELLSAVDRFFTQVSENELMDQPGMQPLRHEFLEEAAVFYERFLDQRGEDPAIQDELAATHFRVGRIRELIQSPSEALGSYQRAYDMQRALVAKRPNGTARLAALGDTINRLGRIMHLKQDFSRSINKYDETIQVRKRLVDLAPQEVEHQRKLANTLMNLALVERDGENWERARRHLEEAQSIRKTILESHPKAWKASRDLATGYFNLATLEIRISEYESAKSDLDPAENRLGAAESHLEAAIAAFLAVLEQKPNSLENKFRLATCYCMLADLKGDLGNWNNALQLFGQAKEHMAVLVIANPEVPEYRATLAELHMKLGLLQKELQKGEDTRANFSKALDHLRPLVDEFPEMARYREDLAIALRELACLPTTTGRNHHARQKLQDACYHFERLADKQPDDPMFQIQLEETRNLLDKLESK